MLHFAICSGIGDTCWMLQKLQNWKPPQPIHFHVVDGMPRRTLPFLEMVPWLGGASYSRVTTREVLNGSVPATATPDDLARWGRNMNRPQPLQCNTHLEDGKDLRTWLPDLRTSYRLNLDIPKASQERAIAWRQGAFRYAVVYAASKAGSRNWNGWDALAWADGIKHISQRVDRVLLVGAEWDRDLADEICKLRPEAVNLIAQTSPADVAALCQKAALVMGFPSGIPILSTLLGTPTFMFWPSHLERMMYAWVDGTCRYVGMQFCPPSSTLPHIESLLEG